MRRAGALPPPPDILQAGVRFTYGSTIERVAKQIEAAALPRAIEIMGPLVQADPGMLDHLDTDAIARDVPVAVGLPQRWLRPLADVKRKRAAATQAVQAQAALAGADQVAGIASKLPPDQLEQVSQQLAQVIPGALPGQQGGGGQSAAGGQGGFDIAALLGDVDEGDLPDEFDDEDGAGVPGAAIGADDEGANAPGGPGSGR